jgi:recombination protein RecR
VTTASAGPEIERLIQLVAKLPGLGPRSARRAVLMLLKRKTELLEPLSAALVDAARAIRICPICGNIDTAEPCVICRDPSRDRAIVCVVEDVGDLWAIERSGVFRGRYHVLGGTLSALDGRGPEALTIGKLIERLRDEPIKEVILALNPTVEGQATAHYVSDQLLIKGVTVSRLALGLPVGGELGYLDDGTLTAAFKSRKPA